MAVSCLSKTKYDHKKKPSNIGVKVKTLQTTRQNIRSLASNENPAFYG